MYMKTVTIVIGLLLPFLTIQGQTSIYVSGGYGLPVGGENYGTSVDYQSSNSYLEQAQYASFGQGLQGHAGVRKMFTETLGLDVNLGLSTNKFVGDFFEDDDDLEMVSYSTTQIQINPSIIVQSGGSKVNVYARFGVALPVYTAITETIENTDKDIRDWNTGENRDYVEMLKADWTTSVGLGLQGGLGVLVPVGSFQLFGEVNMQTLSLRAASRTISFYEDDGDDELRTIPTAEKEVIFLKEITEDNNRPGNWDVYDSDDPSEELAPSLLFNNASIRVGILFVIEG